MPMGIISSFKTIAIAHQEDCLSYPHWKALKLRRLNDEHFDFGCGFVRIRKYANYYLLYKPWFSLHTECGEWLKTQNDIVIGCVLKLWTENHLNGFLDYGAPEISKINSIRLRPRNQSIDFNWLHTVDSGCLNSDGVFIHKFNLMN